MKRAVTLAVVVVLAIVAGTLISNLTPLRDLYDSVINRQPVAASGDVVLQRLREQKELVAATGTFQVPVVVCDGTPKAYDLRDDANEDGETPAQQLLKACDGFLDAKATVLATADVDAVIDLEQLTADDIVVSGDRVSVELPAVQLAEPRVDAESGISVIGRDGSVPLIGGDLPEDYQARAASEAKGAVSSVASQSGLPDLGRRSATRLFEGLLSALGFATVDVTISESGSDVR